MIPRVQARGAPGRSASRVMRDRQFAAPVAEQDLKFTAQRQIPRCLVRGTPARWATCLVCAQDPGSPTVGGPVRCGARESRIPVGTALTLGARVLDGVGPCVAARRVVPKWSPPAALAGRRCCENPGAGWKPTPGLEPGTPSLRVKWVRTSRCPGSIGLCGSSGTLGPARYSAGTRHLRGLAARLVHYAF